jgi:hypothetical protein
MEVLVATAISSVVLAAMMALLSSTQRSMGKVQTAVLAQEQYDIILQRATSDFTKRYSPYPGEQPAFGPYTVSSPCGNLAIRQRIPTTANTNNIQLVVYATQCVTSPLIAIPTQFMSGYLTPCSAGQRFQVVNAIWSTDPSPPMPTFASANTVTVFPPDSDSKDMFAICFAINANNVTVTGGGVMVNGNQAPLSFQKQVSMLAGVANPYVELIR